MAIINVYDKADELRIEILGDFSGPCVAETSLTWCASLPDAMHRRFTVDISGVSGCDGEGRDLLRQMYKHGTQIAAGNPASLGLLTEITSPVRRNVARMPERTQKRISMTRSLRVSAAAS